MAFLGSFLGLIFGAVAGGFAGAFWGAVLGGVGGYALKVAIQSNTAAGQSKPRHRERPLTLADRVSHLEKRIEHLEATVASAATPTRTQSATQGAEPRRQTPRVDAATHPATALDPMVFAPTASAATATPLPPLAFDPAALEPIAAHGSRVTQPLSAASIAASPLPRAPALIPAPIGVPQSSAAPPPAAQPNASASAPSVTATLSAKVPPRPAPYVQLPQGPTEPSFASRVWDWFTTGNVIAKAGAVILFIGVAYLLRYASQHITVPPVFRVIGVATAGIALLGLGWWLRRKREAYALILQGVGVGLLYLTLYGAMALYKMLAPAAAFTMLAAVSMFTAWLAVLQRSQVLAGFGVAGGFLAPVLASTGNNQYVALFGYYVVLNVAILAISWFQAWRGLNLLGFLFTFVIALVWGAHYYQPQYLASTLPFAIAFYAMYLAISVLFALRTARENAAQKAGSKLAHVVDSALVFGVPAFGFAMFAGLLANTRYGLSTVSVILAAIYAAIAFATHYNKHASALTQSFTLLAIVFSTIAVPLGMDAGWAAAVWAVEGAGVLWLSLRQRHKLGAFLGLMLQLGAVIAYLVSEPARDALILNPAFAGALLIASAAVYSSWQLARFSDNNPKSSWASLADALSLMWLLFGLFAWAYAGNGEIMAFLPREHATSANLLFVATSTWGFAMVGRRIGWQRVHFALLLYVPYLLLTVALAWLDRETMLHHLGGFAWLTAIAVAVWQLTRAPSDFAGENSTVWAWQLPALAWLVALLGAHELAQLVRYWQVQQTGWAWAAWVVVGAVLAAGSPWFSQISGGRARGAWRWGYQWPVFAVLSVWIFAACLTPHHGATPLSYWPVLNPLELTMLLALGVLAVATRSIDNTHGDLKLTLTYFGSTLGFIAASTSVMRVAHQYTGVPYELNAILRSTLVQSSLSLVWTLTAMTLMIIATKRTSRGLWMLGAALLAVVAGKLLLVDLGNRSTIEGIIAMIGVGALFMAIGYFSPLPPKAKDA